MSKKTKPTAAAFLEAIRTEAWGFDLPTPRLARLIAGKEAALDEPCTTPEEAARLRKDWEKNR